MNGNRGRAFWDNPDSFDQLDGERDDILVIGGMGSESSQLQLAHAYSDAAMRLIDAAIADGEAWRLSYPILYLCRHALELFLKSVLPRPKPKHNLQPLVLDFEKLIQEGLGERMPRYLRADLLTLASIDPDGQGFRYTTGVDGGEATLPGEHWISLPDLQRLMKVMSSAIELTHRRLDLGA